MQARHRRMAGGGGRARRSPARKARARARDRRRDVSRSRQSPKSPSSSRPLSRSRARISRRAQADRCQPFGDRDERPRILVRRRRVHQHRAAVAVDDAEIAAERRIAGERQDLGALPTRKRQGIQGHAAGGIHRGGHRPSHDGGTSAVKILSPSGAKSSDRRSASGHAVRPARSGHSTSSTASAGGIEPELLDLRRILDPVEIDVPHRRVELLIGLDDREARARHLALMAERRDEARAPARSCRRRAARTA